MISIIIPTYNRARFLPRAIRCILAQTVENWELVIVDDGSTDNTKESIKDFLKDERIRYDYQENQGAPVARNRGAYLAKNEFILFYDSDDEALPEMLEVHLKNINNHPNLGLSFAGYINILRGREKIPPRMQSSSCFGNHKINVLSCTYAVKKNIFIEAGGFDVRLPQSQNWDLMIRMIQTLELKNMTSKAIDTPVFVFQNDWSEEKKGKKIKWKIEASQIIYKKYLNEKVFSKKDLGGLAERIAYNSFLLKRRMSALKWQVAALRHYSFNPKGYLRLGRYLF